MNEIQKTTDFEKLYGDVCVIIEQARDNAYRAVNLQLTLRNWLIGECVAKEELQGEARAAYGKQIISELSKKLTDHYGAGFDFSSIYQYIKFYRLFPQILDAVSPELRIGFGILDATNPKSDNGDNPTVGILLCSDTSEDMALYSVLNGNNQLFQAKYMIYLPSKEELRREIETQKHIFELQHSEDG